MIPTDRSSLRICLENARRHRRYATDPEMLRLAPAEEYRAWARKWIAEARRLLERQRAKRRVPAARKRRG